MKNWYHKLSKIELLAWCLIVLGIISTIYFIGSSYIDNYKFYSTEKIDFAVTGQFGDFIGGFVGTLVSIAGFIFLYITLKDQRDNFIDSKVETRIYEMIKIHRENVSEMEYTYYDIPESNDFDFTKNEIEQKRRTAKARKVFKIINNDFELLYKELDYIFNKKKIDDIYVPTYLTKLNRNCNLLIREIDLIQYAKIDITYLIIFFGLSQSGISSIKSFFKERYVENLIEDILFYASLKPKRESKYFNLWYAFHEFKDIEGMSKLMQYEMFKSRFKLSFDNKNNTAGIEWGFTYPNSFIKYYGGHQFRLGHYFRHLYQTVSFIHEQENLEESDKYEAVKLLRGQISTYEQYIIFYNSISILGRIWEMEDFHNNSKALETRNQLITKYNLIKNIASDDLFGDISTSKYYPLITFESRNNSNIKITRSLIFK